MLGKLIKYDLKALNRFLILIHAFLLAASAACRLFITGRINADANELNQILLALSIIFYFILFIGVSWGTQIIIAVRVYKNIFSDEGYLTNTLPVTRGQLLLSKTIAGSIWSTIDAIFIYLCTFLLLATPYVITAVKENGDELLQVFGIPKSISLAAVFFWFLLLILIGGIGNTILLYASIVLGQLFGSHRVLGSVVAYFVLTALISVFTLLFMTVTGSFSVAMTSAAENTILPYDYFKNTLMITIILETVTSIILYGISYWMMEKKMNLN